jgi:hypothetical protein
LANKKYNADIEIRSPTGGNITFSQKKNGEHYENNSWGKLSFPTSYSADLSRDDRIILKMVLQKYLRLGNI